MKAINLKATLAKIPDNAEVYFSNDEEWNCLRKGGRIVKANVEGKKNEYVIYGLDGTEV